MFVVTNSEEAVKNIKPRAVIAINGFGGMGTADEIFAAIEKRFLETGMPNDLTLWFAAGMGGRGLGTGTSRFGHEGMVKRVIGGHWGADPALSTLAAEEKVEAYNLPQGVISHLFRAAAGRKPGIITSIGLRTFIDPRLEGGKINKSAKEDLVSLRLIDGKEYLEYKAPKIDVALIRGTTADCRGNISLEKEAAFLDVLSIAQAAKANGGIVICQVERLSAGKTHPKMVKVPGAMIDYIVLAPEQKQTRVEVFNPAYSGDLFMTSQQIKEHNNKLAELSVNSGMYGLRSLKDWIIARRASLELKSNSVINLGVGIPGMIGAVAEQEGVSNLLTMTVEAGTVGGVPVQEGSFGATINPDIIYEQSMQFDFYDGGNLDITFVGGLQIDVNGNVNVSKNGSIIPGVGGFVNITQTAKKVVFCNTFTGGKDLNVEFKDNKLIIKGEGKISKFINKVAQVSFSGEYAAELGQEVLYITERAVFKLTAEGVMLIEIAPGIDLEKDILSRMEFMPIISNNLKLIDKSCFTDGSLGMYEMFNSKNYLAK